MKQKILIKTLDKNTYEIEGELVKTTSKSKAPGWFQEFHKNFNEFKNETINRLDYIENDIKAIKNTPTIKKELNK